MPPGTLGFSVIRNCRNRCSATRRGPQVSTSSTATRVSRPLLEERLARFRLRNGDARRSVLRKHIVLRGQTCVAWMAAAGGIMQGAARAMLDPRDDEAVAEMRVALAAHRGTGA